MFDELQDQKPMIYNSEDEFFSKKTLTLVRDAGILNAVESLLKSLPDSVRHSMSAGEVVDTVLAMIADLREKGRREDE